MIYLFYESNNIFCCSHMQLGKLSLYWLVTQRMSSEFAELLYIQLMSQEQNVSLTTAQIPKF